LVNLWSLSASLFQRFFHFRFLYLFIWNFFLASKTEITPELRAGHYARTEPPVPAGKYIYQTAAILAKYFHLFLLI